MSYATLEPLEEIEDFSFLNLCPCTLFYYNSMWLPSLANAISVVLAFPLSAWCITIVFCY